MTTYEELPADVRELIGNLLMGAYKFDDKPHQLFSAVLAIVERFEDNPDFKREENRLMNAAYTCVCVADLERWIETRKAHDACIERDAQRAKHNEQFQETEKKE